MPPAEAIDAMAGRNTCLLVRVEVTAAAEHDTQLAGSTLRNASVYPVALCSDHATP